MDSFSKRNKFDPKIPTSPIVESAPRILRLEYWKRVLEPLTYIDMDTRYEREDNALLGRKKLLEELCVLLHVDPNDQMNDSWFCTDELKGLIMDVPWYHFYDIVEYIGKIILKSQGLSFFFGHQEVVNEILNNNFVVWELKNDSMLLRTALPELEEKNEDLEEMLQEGFPSALANLRKAKRFLTQRPLDPENAIKEAVSAVESYGRTLYPKTSTLGDVIKELRKTPFPDLLLTMMEKFYAFTSSEPGIRHGSAVSSRTDLADADFSWYISLAFMDYLHKLHQK
jgi:hypothetical protein